MAKKYPVLAYVLFCGVFALLAFGTFSLGSYDDGGIGLVGMLLIIVWSIIAFPFSIPMQLAGPGLGMAVGLLLCAVGEIVIQLVRMRRG